MGCNKNCKLKVIVQRHYAGIRGGEHNTLYLSLFLFFCFVLFSLFPPLASVSHFALEPPLDAK